MDAPDPIASDDEAISATLTLIATEQLKSLVPIVLPTDRDRILGSGTLLRLADDYFVVTASHVLSELDDSPTCGTRSFVDSRFIPFEGDGTRAGDDHPSDVGLLRLADGAVSRLTDAGYRFLTSAQFESVTPEQVTSGSFLIAGWPAELAGTFESSDRFQMQVFLSRPCDSNDVRVDRDAFRRELHFLLGGSRKLVNLKTSEPDLLLSSTEGMSGGSVWWIDDAPSDPRDAADRARWIAVMIGQHPEHGPLQATVLAPVFELLVQKWPGHASSLDLLRECVVKRTIRLAAPTMD